MKQNQLIIYRLAPSHFKGASLRCRVIFRSRTEKKQKTLLLKLVKSLKSLQIWTSEEKAQLVYCANNKKVYDQTPRYDIVEQYKKHSDYSARMFFFAWCFFPSVFCQRYDNNGKGVKTSIKPEDFIKAPKRKTRKQKLILAILFELFRRKEIINISLIWQSKKFHFANIRKNLFCCLKTGQALNKFLRKGAPPRVWWGAYANNVN